MNPDQKNIFDAVSFSASRATTRAYSTSFSSGIRLLNKRFRNPVYAIYGFVRFADEIVDTFHAYDKPALMAKFREDTMAAVKDGISLNPILNSFQITFHQYHFNIELVEQFLHSMEMDLQAKNHDRGTFENYILGSAEVVGLMCLKVFTERDDVKYNDLKSYAQTLGAAFQKINFLRDVKADFELLGRSYFPGLDLENFSESEKINIQQEIEKDLAIAHEGIKQLPKDARLGVFVAYVYYRGLFKKIKSVPSHRIMQERIRIPNQQKLTLVLGCYLRNNLNLI